MTEPFARLNITPVLAVIRHRFVWAAIMMLCLSGALPGWASDALAADDAYIAGYAAAVLHQEARDGVDDPGPVGAREHQDEVARRGGTGHG